MGGLGPSTDLSRFPSDREYDSIEGHLHRNLKALGLHTAALLTLKSGSITVLTSNHRIATEGGASTDNAAEAKGGYPGMVLILHADDTTKTVVVKHNDTGEGTAGNRYFLDGDADHDLDDNLKTITFLYRADIDSDSGGWQELLRSSPDNVRKIIDTDRDTSWDTEESPDEDILRAKVAGTERVTIHNTGDILRLLGIADENPGLKITALDALGEQPPAGAEAFVQALWDGFTGKLRLKISSREFDFTGGGPLNSQGLSFGLTDSIGFLDNSPSPTARHFEIIVNSETIMRHVNPTSGDSFIESAAWRPFTDGDQDLGTASKRWRDLYLSGTIRSASAPTSIQVGGSIVTGADQAAADDVSLDLVATNRALLLNRLTTTQRNALTALDGMALYNTTTGKFEVRENGAWVDWRHTKYTDAEAVAAVEGEATLDLAGDVTIDGAKTLKVDVINEKDADAGVTIDSVLLKDGLVDGIDVAARDHAQTHNILDADHADSVAASAVRGDLIVANSTPKLARLAAGDRKASTTPASIQTQWAGLTGTARQVLVKDSGGDLSWAYISAIDIQNPPRINSFSDGLAATFEIDNAGTRSPSFLLTYEGTPSACQITMDAQMETDLEVTGSDYPQNLTGDFGVTAEAGAAIKNAITAAMINRLYTWTATATVDGTSGLTKTTTLKWLNRKYHGPDTKSTDLTSAEILALDATGDGGSSLDADYKGTWTVDAAANEYIWFAFRSALTPDPTFTIGGIEGGFTKMGTVSHTNDSGFVETFQMWRSDNHSLGSTTVTVT